MSATTNARLTDFKGVTPSRGTYPIAADVKILKGTIVGVDSSGRAVPGDTIANGCLSALGKASATYDNTGGTAAAMDVEVEYGVFGWENSAGGDAIAADDVGKVCFIGDNQSVALTSNTDTRGICGFITEFRGGVPYVWMGPHVVGMIVIASSEASQLDTAQTEIDALQADVLELQVDAATTKETLWIPLASFVDSDGDPLAKFVDSASTVPGFNLADSEAFGIRWNNHATPGVILSNLPLGYRLDDAAAVTVLVLASKTGATVGDAVTFLVTAYFITVGALHDADANAGGTTGAMTGNATAKTVQQVSLAIAHGDVPAGPCVLNLTIKPTDGTLGTDDVIVHAVGVQFTRKVQTS